MSQGQIIWFIGLSGAGKTTIALHLKKILQGKNIPVIHLDGDIMREGLNKDLGFSDKDRFENIRRAAEMAKILAKQGYYVIASFITPKKEYRTLAKDIIKNANIRLSFIYVKCSLSTCQRRDVKGLYKKANKGMINHFTGISSDFETPDINIIDLTIDTEQKDIHQSTEEVISYLQQS